MTAKQGCEALFDEILKDMRNMGFYRASQYLGGGQFTQPNTFRNGLDIYADDLESRRQKFIDICLGV